MIKRMDSTGFYLLRRQAYWSRSDMIRIIAEADRARHEESRLLEENRKQSEQIKALADALEALNNRRVMQYVSAPGHHTIEMTNHEVSTMVAALRFVGR